MKPAAIRRYTIVLQRVLLLLVAGSVDVARGVQDSPFPKKEALAVVGSLERHHGILPLPRTRRLSMEVSPSFSPLLNSSILTRIFVLGI